MAKQTAAMPPARIGSATLRNGAAAFTRVTPMIAPAWLWMSTGVVAAMALLGLVATWIPAQRALSVNPMILLRED